MPKISLNIDELNAEKKQLGEFLALPDAYSDPDFTAKNKRFSELESIIEKVALRDTLEQQLAEAKELANGSDELAELAKSEVSETEAKLATLEDELFIMLAPRDPNDDKNVIMEIRAGAGGDEASLFAAELYRMYLRYCEAQGLKPNSYQRVPTIPAVTRRSFSKSVVTHPTRDLNSSPASTGCNASRLPNHKAVSIRVPSLSPSCRKQKRPISRSILVTSGSISTVRAAMAASPSTQLIAPSVSPTCPPASS